MALLAILFLVIQETSVLFMSPFSFPRMAIPPNFIYLEHLYHLSMQIWSPILLRMGSLPDFGGN